MSMPTSESIWCYVRTSYICDIRSHITKQTKPTIWSHHCKVLAIPSIMHTSRSGTNYQALNPIGTSFRNPPTNAIPWGSASIRLWCSRNDPTRKMGFVFSPSCRADKQVGGHAVRSWVNTRPLKMSKRILSLEALSG